MNAEVPLVNNETSAAAERKQDDFSQLRQAAMERADHSSRVPVVVLPGAACSLCALLAMLITCKDCGTAGGAVTKHAHASRASRCF